MHARLSDGSAPDQSYLRTVVTIVPLAEPGSASKMALIAASVRPARERVGLMRRSNVRRMTRWFVLILIIAELALWVRSDIRPPSYFMVTLVTLAAWLVAQIVRDARSH